MSCRYYSNCLFSIIISEIFILYNITSQLFQFLKTSRTVLTQIAQRICKFLETLSNLLIGRSFFGIYSDEAISLSMINVVAVNRNYLYVCSWSIINNYFFWKYSEIPLADILFTTLYRFLEKQKTQTSFCQTSHEQLVAWSLKINDW
ncbi:MAG: hypothetical protein Ta2E_12830 [Mycoplasmoidaceae bacterium]|nr:MAG: hypothetical protein Ta2E_12830 [Mycoplasmoidaceae bacterium]